jgi:pimeloyl-ACP methyl ester carboxylesterase
MMPPLQVLAGIALVVGLGSLANAEVVAGPCVVQPDPEAEVTARIDCGEVVLPMDPADTDRGTVRLPFLRARGPTDGDLPPMLMLSGGPGSSLMAPSVYQLLSDGYLGPILSRRDIVVLEERGGYYTTPALDCPAFDRAAVAAQAAGPGADAVAIEAKAIAGCAAEVRAAGIDLDLFNSVAMAADIEGTRLALGYDRWLVYGASYGTMLAQHYLRDFPASVEAMILDGAEPLSNTSWAQDRARRFDYAVTNIANLCKADPLCAANYDTEGLITAGVDLFDEGPIRLSSTEDAGLPVFSHDLKAEEFAEFIYEEANGQIAIRTLPRVLSLMVKDGRDGMAAFLGPMFTEMIKSSETPQPGGLVALMHYAVVCSDDPVRSEADLMLDPETPEYAAIFGRRIVRKYVAGCKAVGVRELPPETDVDPMVDVPILILAGLLDSRTPAFYAEKLAAELPQVTLAEFPEGSHVQVGEINRCAAEIMVAFAADPEKAPDLSCIAAIPQRGFALPDGTMSRNP